MCRKLLTVLDTFAIGPRVILIPGFHASPAEEFRVGDMICLKRPDGSEVQTTIGGFDLSNRNPPDGLRIVLSELSEGDVPVGTEVWSIR
jgi:hypothetical protein